MIWQKTIKNSIPCNNFVDRSIPQSLDHDIFKSTFCQRWSLGSFNDLIDYAMSPYWPVFGLKLARYGFTETIASDFFKENSDPFSFYALFTSTNTEVSQWYDCQEPDRCNSHELAVKQWANSTVTMNPPDLIRQFYPQAISVKDWQQGWF